MYEVKIIENKKPKIYHIFPHEYTSIPSPIDKYNTIRKPSTNKHHVNSLFVQFLQRFPRPNRKIIYLDHLQLLTTKYLVDANIADELIIPNLIPNFKKLAQKNEYINHVNVQHQSIYELIRDTPQDQGPFDFGFDYCCSLNGNNLIKPKIDIELAFHNQLIPKHNGVLWFTFSHRSIGGATELINQLSDFIVLTAEAYNYPNIYLLEHGTYKSVTYLFFVTSNTQN